MTWDIIPKIGTWFSLTAFVVAVVFLYLQNRLRNKLNLIKSIPVSERTDIVDRELNDFRVNTDDLTRQQKYELLKQKLDSQNQRFRSMLNVSLILSLSVLAAFVVLPRIVGNLSADVLPVTESVNEWVAVTNGQIPKNAFHGGSEPDGTPIYIARVKHEGGLHIGKARQGGVAAAIPFGGKELWLENYEVYVGKGRWGSTTYKTPDSAIEGGCENNGTPLYIARAYIENGWHIGKARNNAPEAFIPYGGQEKVVSKYQLLVR